MTLKKGGEKTYDLWDDPDSMKELQWLLARPTVFPVVSPLSPTIALGSSPSQAPCMKVFNVLELFDIIIDYIVGPDIPQLAEKLETFDCIVGQDVSQTQLASELQANDSDAFTPSCIIQTTKTIFALLQVNKSLYTTFLRHRQNIFLRIAWMHGWMLPFTPRDWKNWPNGIFHNGSVLKVGHNQDWRTYLLTFLRKEDVHVRNRWRFHKMAVQFGRGQSMAEFCWRSQVGDVDFRPDVKKAPEPWCWEME
ncbi:hypothetical protein Clacol_010363 [Clathrus columnatus]|uniref:Uncharacterized protein n=1 Tax=Clathrus columnatus TaxID=1419009 RepID=A0AAV5ASF2_9AGAM|nr:hypothetical protein Clacol_010363 [Clathrus columnatus]